MDGDTVSFSSDVNGDRYRWWYYNTVGNYIPMEESTKTITIVVSSSMETLCCTAEWGEPDELGDYQEYTTAYTLNVALDPPDYDPEIYDHDFYGVPGKEYTFKSSNQSAALYRISIAYYDQDSYGTAQVSDSIKVKMTSGLKYVYIAAYDENDKGLTYDYYTVYVDSAYYTEPTLTSVNFSASSVQVGKNVTITAVTNTAVAKLTMYAENGSAVKTWTGGYTDSGTTRTWKVSYAFGGAGSRTLSFRGTGANGTATASKSVSITVTK